MRVKKASTKQKSLRLTSLFLSLCMIVGLLPVSIFAAEDSNEQTVVDAAVIFSDLHTSSSNYKKDTLTGIMTAIKDTGLPVSSVTSAGDAFSVNSGSGYTGYTSTLTGYIQGVLGNVPVNYVWSDHDRCAVQEDDSTLLSNDSGMVYGAGEDGEYGTEDDANYYIYSLSMADLSTNNRYNADFHTDEEVTAAIADFTATVSGLNKDRPLFIASHQPLFDRRNDNGHALEWCTAINAAAEEMDIAFFFGHNHNYDKTEDYYYPKGSTMPVCKPDYSSQNVQLNFTHMCAGYMAPSSTGSTSNTTRQGVAVVMTIYEDAINYTTYDDNGVYTGNYALNETVTRDFAAEPEVVSLSVEDRNNGVYTVGDDLNVKVTATYDDDSTADVTADAKFARIDGSETKALDMDEAGTYLVYARYEGVESDPFEITVSPKINTVTYLDDTMSVQASAPDLTDIDVENIWGKPDLSGVFIDYMSFDVTLKGHTEGNEVFYSVSLADNMDTLNLELYHIAEDGQLIPVACELVTDVQGNQYVEFTTTYVGAFAYGAPVIPEGFALSSIMVSNIKKTEYFVGDDLDLVNPVVIGTYTKEGSPNFRRTIYPVGVISDEDGYTADFDMDKAGKQLVVITYQDCTVSFEIEVFEKILTHTATGITVEVDVPGATDIVVGDSTNPYVDYLMGEYVKNDSYVAYDIAVEGFQNGDNATVTLPVPAGMANPVVYYVSDSGSTVMDMDGVVSKDGLSISFETDHFSSYVVGDGFDIVVPDPDEVDVTDATSSETKTVYVRVNSIENGGKYLIVNTDKNQALANNSGTQTAAGVTVTTGTAVVGSTTYTEYIESPSSNAVWTAATSGNGFSLTNDGDRLRARKSSSGDMISSTGSSWTYNGTNHYLSSSSYYVRYSNNAWSNSTTQSSVYLYKEVTASIKTSANGTYSIEEVELTKVVEAGTKYTLETELIFTPDDNTEPNKTPIIPVYTVVDDAATADVIDGDPNGVIAGIDENGVVTFTGETGKALLKVSYAMDEGTVTSYILITAKAPSYILDITAGEKVITNTTVAIKGDEKINAGYQLGAKLSFEDTDGIKPGTVDSAKLTWRSTDTSIATVDANGAVTFTGEEGEVTILAVYEYAADLSLTAEMTFSVSKSLYIVPEDGTDDFPKYPEEGAVRFDKTAEAVGNFSETGIAKVELSMTAVPYTTNTRLDVALMLDHSNSMTEARMSATRAAVEVFVSNIVKNEDGSFNDNRVYIGSFAGGNPEYAGQSRHEFRIYTMTANEEDGYQVINNQTELNNLIDKINSTYVKFSSNTAPYGTEYDQSLEECYNILNNSKADGNKQFCVFMSDGIPNVYRYGAGDDDQTTSSENMAAMFTPTSGTKYTSRDSDYKYEYWSSLMKADGVTVFTVGLGLNGTNSSLSGATAAECERVSNMLLNDISGPAGETATQRDTGSAVTKKDKYFFSVADANAAADMKDVFDNIAQKIVETADVVVEDKVGDDYSLNFKLPGGVNADDVGGQEFYIQAVEYQLDADKNRTGTPAVLENFTFDNGNFKSHTVNGVACSNCSHVTVTDGTITKIEGTYFSYENKGDGEGKDKGEYLIWKAEKLTTTELALQYFAYLDNSADAVGTGREIPAGTYYTNEYATLTYTNYKGNRVQQEFPVPQMTWNGAQVAYTFYLVNDAGQPVNRAGRVVPFAEAVYVTDVYHHSIVWNDLEQSAGLEADYLAEQLVPDAFALYDDDAAYKIHVYEDEDEVNLNNHFIIVGDVTDDYNNKRTNANTTYVFNNKADAIKYNTAGAYIANDGNDGAASTAYLCKGEGTVEATISEAAGVTKDNFADQPYFIKNADGKYVQAIAYTEGTTYYEISSASYTKVSGETQWAPGSNDSTSGGTVINGYVYYIDENGAVYTIVQRSNGTEVRHGFDFHNTTVAFAVVWNDNLVEDTVVIDYGLDVVIDVITNDSVAAGVVGVRADAPANVIINTGDYEAKKDKTATLKNAADEAVATVQLIAGNLTSVKFSLTRANSSGMQLNEPVSFYYEAELNYYNDKGNLETVNKYSKVTVIPATTVYYEDEYVKLDTATSNESGEVSVKSGWTYTEGSSTIDGKASKVSATQAQDRPGVSKISKLYDADNNYGYDSAYDQMSQYSMKSAARTTVTTNKAARASFSFYGTGFDVISMTDTTTGTIIVDVYKDTTASPLVCSYIVDTYYGYAYGDSDGDGKSEWYTVDSNNPNALYQVPVMKVFDLPYADENGKPIKYRAEIMAVYDKAFDHKNVGSYDFYLDAIRIYDPTGDQNETAKNAYGADGEMWPEYTELRNMVISKATFDSLGSESVSGIVFIDGNAEVDDAEIADYISYGPNNELYLAEGEAVAAKLTAKAAAVDGYELASIQLGIKTVGGTGTVKVYGIESGKEIVAIEQDIATATDMYYDITELNGMDMVIQNKAGAIVSITNIKVTYKPVAVPAPALVDIEEEDTDVDTASPEEEYEIEEVALLSVSKETATVALMSLRSVEVEDDTTENIPEAEKPKPGKPEKPGKDKPNKPEKPAKPEKPDNPNKGPQNNSGNNKNNGKNNKWNNNHSNGRNF